MQLHARFILCALLALLFSGPETAWAQFKEGPRPTLEAKPNDVYGLVNFSLTASRRGAPIRDAVKALIESLAPLLSKQGDYILTIEVLASTGDVVARRAIIQATREEKGFLIFNRVLKQTSTTEWYGNILNTSPIVPANNNVKIKIRSYYSKQAKFDLDTFNLLADLVAKTNILALAPDLQSAWQPIATQMQTLLNSYEQQDVSDIASFSFVKFNEEPFPQSGTFTRKFERNETGGTAPYEASVAVKLEPVWARVVTLKDGKVDEPLYRDVLAASRIGDVLIETVLANSKDANVKKLLVGFQSDRGYEGTDIGDKCDALYQELAQSFTRTDAIATYWALVHRYDRVLSLNKAAKDCVDSQLRTRMTGLGLPTDDLRFLESSGGAVAAVATSPADAINEASASVAIQGAPPMDDEDGADNEADDEAASPVAGAEGSGEANEAVEGGEGTAEADVTEGEEQAETSAGEAPLEGEAVVPESATYEFVPLDSPAPLE
jgi:hypothetical protein